MSLFKCKMCGGTLEVNNETVAVCQYCGTKQTLPKLDDDRRANLYDRANHFRRDNEFDKASAIYEQILNEDGSDAEAYWSLVLCRYGIEYVEDPSSNKRIPTVNRAQFTSVFDDDNYKSALQYADGYQRDIYEQEASAINDIQKGILAISSQEEPFDVFICYKETNANGRRTPDSVLANDLYYQLTQEGFKVFFARITLEDKLGSAYEPYIFAALNSAKVMVVLGTKPEYFNAVWVKNEWSRYLSLVKISNGKKIIIPAYKDMDPYNLPEEFSHLQAQDMSKLGFMQDLIRGIKKITQSDVTKTTVVKETVDYSNSASPLLKRVFMFLEDGEWDDADEYCEKVLDINPECGEAYLGKLMVDLKVRHRRKLDTQTVPFDNNPYYQKAMRFGDTKLRNELENYIQNITDRLERARLLEIYNKGISLLEAAKTEEDCINALEVFDSIVGFEDSEEKAKQCKEKANEICLSRLYAAAVSLMKLAKTEEAFVKASNAFNEIKEYKDSKILSEECLAKAETARLEKKRLDEQQRQIEEQIVSRNKSIRNKWLIAQLSLVILFFMGIFISFLSSEGFLIGNIIAMLFAAPLFWGLGCGLEFITTLISLFLNKSSKAQKFFSVIAILSSIFGIFMWGLGSLGMFISLFSEFSVDSIFSGIAIICFWLAHLTSFIAIILKKSIPHQQNKSLM